MSATDATPSQIEMLHDETLQLVCDFSALLGIGETLGTPVALLTQIDTGTDVSSSLLSGTALALSNTAVSTVVAGLIAGKSYRLIWQGTVATNKILAQKIRLECPA